MRFIFFLTEDTNRVKGCERIEMAGLYTHHSFVLIHPYHFFKNYNLSKLLSS